MKISLAIVRDTLRENLGFESFTAGFISRIEQDKNIPTAAINREGHLHYNPQFMDQHINCKEELFSLILHEILHPMFNHFIRDSGPIENLASDAIINAIISMIYCSESNNGQLFKKLYPPKGPEGLLRPLSRMSNSRFSVIYDRLYTNYSHSSMTTGELITALRILLPPTYTLSMDLLGSHKESSDLNGEFAKETLEKMATDLKRVAKRQMGRNAGYSTTLMDMLMDVLRTHISIKRQILQRLATDRKVDKFKELCRSRKITSSPIPIYPSKRDLILLGTGFYPGFFHNQIEDIGRRNRGLAIYLDVSGSVNEYLPKILGILISLRSEINSIFLFSNKVYEVPFKALLKGRIKTTGGTDFDCVAESIMDANLDKAIVLTDGYASMSSANHSKLMARRVLILTILFHSAHECQSLKSFGDVVFLEDISH